MPTSTTERAISTGNPAFRKVRLPFRTDTTFFIVVVFGLCGAFVSNLMGLAKIHYVPLFSAVLIMAVGGIKAANFVPYFFASLFLLLSPVVAGDANEYLSHLSVSVLPFLWFCAGRELHPRRLAHACLGLTVALALGLAIETTGVFSDLFPIIGVRLGDEVALRYGSFALNPLALGYFACLSATLALCIERRIWRWTSLALNILLLIFADSRGGMITFAIALTVYVLLRGFKKRNSRLAGAGWAWVGVAIALGIVASLVSTIPRLSSIFDWSVDEGNLGRLNQWGYCLSQIVDSPFIGKGAGAMSPIGIGDDPYIAAGIVKSCDSTILKLGVEYGAVFSIAYFAILIYLVAKTISKIKQAKRAQAGYVPTAELSCAIAVTISIFLQQFINQTIESIWTGATFFAFLGYASARTRGLSGSIHQWRSFANGPAIGKS